VSLEEGTGGDTNFGLCHAQKAWGVNSRTAQGEDNDALFLKGRIFKEFSLLRRGALKPPTKARMLNLVSMKGKEDKRIKRQIALAKKKGRLQKIIKRFESTYTVNNLETLYFRPCIYFLKCRHEIVYIGETTSVMSRITQHIQDNVKIFDSFSFEVYKGSEKERKAEEARLIKKVKPFYNKIHNN